MRAIALLGPDVAEREVEPFRVTGVEVEVAPAVVPADAALVFGGDGTMHRHLPELRRLQIPVLAVPAGSGNDFAHALGLRAVADALAAWRAFVAGKGSVRSIDLGVIEAVSSGGAFAGEDAGAPKTAPATFAEDAGDPKNVGAGAPNPAGHGAQTHLFCCVGGAGLDADANRRANRMPRWLRRHGGYMLAAALAILGKHPAHTRAFAATPAGEPLLDADEEAEMIAFANAPTYGDGLLIAPGAKLDDGKLDIVYVRRASRLRLLRVAPRILSGRHIELPEVWFARAAELTLECDPPRPIYADGEYCGDTPARITVLPKALRVITRS